MRVILAGIVGGVLLFFWGFVAHMLLPFSEQALKPVPNEAAMLDAVRANITENGVYALPHLNYKTASEADKQAYADKVANGHSGLLVIRTGGVSMDMKKELSMEFLSNVLAALVAALAVAGIGVRGYGGRVGTIFAFGVVAWLSVSVSQWTWYGFSTDFLISDLVDQWGGWLLAGLGMAAILKPRR
ncbi:hypothetical protein [Lysobacter tyrosinilyticus]